MSVLKKKIRTTSIFFKIDLCSATLIESSRRELFKDMAEHISILKNNQNTHLSLKVALCSATSIKALAEAFRMTWLKVGLS